MQSSIEWLQFAVVFLIVGGALAGLLYIKARSAGVSRSRAIGGLLRVGGCVIGFVGVGCALRALNGGALFDVQRDLAAPGAGYGVTTSVARQPVSQGLLVAGIALMALLGYLAMRAVRAMTSNEIAVTRKPLDETEDRPS
jgi:hypothetical protein